MERPPGPENYRRRQGEPDPLPTVELQRLDHAEQRDGDGQDRRDHQPDADSGPGVACRIEAGAVAGCFDGSDELLGSDADRVVAYGGSLGRVVDR